MTTRKPAIKRPARVNNSVRKWHTVRFQVPEEALPIIHDFMRKVKFYATEGEFAESTFAYSLWCEQPHHLTGPSFATKELRRKMWSEIISDYGKPKKAGSYFQHRLEETIEQRKK